MDAQLEQVGAVAQPVDRRARVRHEPRRLHARAREQAGDVIDHEVRRPVDVERDRRAVGCGWPGHEGGSLEEAHLAVPSTRARARAASAALKPART